MCLSAHDSNLCQSLRKIFLCNDWHFVFFYKCSLFLILLLIGNVRSARAQYDVNVDSVISRVYTYVDRCSLRNDGFTSEVYVQHYLRTKRKGIIMRYLPGALHLERGENEYFGENLAHYNFSPPAQVDQKDVAVFSTMPYVKKPRDKWLGRYSISIYEPNLFTDRILSPFNASNRRFYKYRFKYAYQVLGNLIAHIEIVPRIWNSQLVRGNADINVNTGEVRVFSLKFFYGWSRLQVSGEMGREGKATLLPQKITLMSRMKMFGNKLEEQFDATASFDFRKTPQADTIRSFRNRKHFDVTELCRLRVDTTSVRRDLAYFEEHRPVRLMDSQRAIYDKAMERQDRKVDSIDVNVSHARLDMAEDIILDSHTLQIGAQGKVRFPPLITPSMVEWSKNDGFALRTRFSFDFALKRHNHLQFKPRVGYNFKQKQVYWQCPLVFRFRPKYDAWFKIEASGGDHIYSSRQADDVREKLVGISKYDSIVNIFNRYNFHYYRDNRFLVESCFQPIVGLKLSGGLRFHQRRMLNWNAFAAKTDMRHTLRGCAPRLRVEWTPALYYYRENKRPIPIRTKWPTFMVDYERSLRAVDEHTAYERVEFDASYKLRMRALRSLYFRVGGGLYTKRAENCFLDYDNFRYSPMPTSVRSAFSGQFQLLDGRWYNESDYYVRMSATYESPMLLFSRIKYFTRLVSKEFLYCNLLNVRALPIYTEFGYGISLPLLRLAAFGAISGKGQSAFGCKIAFELGEFY